MSENSTHTQSNIDSIAKQEYEFLEQRTLSERASDRIAGFAGSMFFVLIHVLLVLFWVLTNLNRVPWIPRFDSYPFSLLGMIVLSRRWSFQALYSCVRIEWQNGESGEIT